MTKKIDFSNSKKIKMIKLFEDGMSLIEIRKIFECSFSTVRKNLINFLGLENYKKIAKEHSQENARKIGRKYGQENVKKAQEVAATLPRSKKQRETSREIGRKVGSLPKTEKQREASQENGRKSGRENIIKYNKSKKARENIKKVHKFNAENHNWISNPEHLFFLKCLTKMFFLKNIKKQFYLKGLNHAFDFAIPSQKLLFEIDGDYWHKDRKKQDTEIDTFAKSVGWSIMRFDDKKLKELKVI